MKMLQKTWLFTKEHFNELFIFFCFITISILVYKYKSEIFTKSELYKYSTSLVALFGVFLGWLQFIFYKYNKKKEAAITYFPKPLELEKLEGEIDEIINFWTRKDCLDNYEVSLMLGYSIEDEEYQLVWKKLSTISKLEVKQKAKSLEGNDDNKAIDVNSYEESTKPFIDELYKQARRKLNAYLNQIEAYCLAINKGNIDLKASKELFNHKFYIHYKKARPYIDRVRDDKHDNTLYIEFENVLRKWGKL